MWRVSSWSTRWRRRRASTEGSTWGYVAGVDSAAEVLGVLFAISIGLFVVISLLVLVPGRSRGGGLSPHDAVWFGGPDGSVHGAGASPLVLTDWRPHHGAPPEVDWVRLAETAEPGRGVGGASAEW
jgi:hypothetical protein